MHYLRFAFLSALLFCSYSSSSLFGQSGSAPSGETGEKVLPSSITNRELLRVGDESYTVADIAEAWSRTPGKDLPSFYDLPRDSALNFINLYADFRLKVLEAESRGLDKREEFVQEMDRNRDQVALGIGPFGSVSGEGYLFQRKLVDPGVEEIWSRRNDEVRVAVIFSFMDPNDPADTLRAFNRTVDMLKRLRNGADFRQLAVDSTDHTEAKKTAGDIGWVTGGMMPRPMEDAAFETTVGEVYPDVVRIPSGYVLLKVLDRDQRRKVQIGHIIFNVSKRMDGTDNEDEARVRAEAAMARINAGESFEDVARETSDDRTSAEHGGHLLSWYTRSLGFESRPGKLPPTFESTVFSLDEGEVSDLTQDEIGFRIVKLVESKVPTFEEEEKAVRDIYRRYFMENDRNQFIDATLEKHGFGIDPATLEAVLSSVDTNRSAADSTWASNIPSGFRTRPFFSILGKSWTVQNWIDSIETSPRYRALPLSRISIVTSVKTMVEYLALKEEVKDLEQDYPDFARLMGEFHDGALIFELEQQEIYENVSFKEDEGKKFFEERRDNYMTPIRVGLSEIFVYTEKDARALYKRATAGEDFNELAKNHTERQGFRQKEGKWPLNNAKDSELVRIALENESNPRPGQILEPFPYTQGWSIIKIDEIEAPRQQSYQEARGAVMGDFNDWKERTLRQTLLTSFRKKFPVKIDTKALDAALGA